MQRGARRQFICARLNTAADLAAPKRPNTNPPRPRAFRPTLRMRLDDPLRTRTCSRIRRPEAEVSTPAFLPWKNTNLSTSGCAETVDTTGDAMLAEFARSHSSAEMASRWPATLGTLSSIAAHVRHWLGRTRQFAPFLRGHTRGLERVGARRLGNVNGKRD